MNVNTIHVNQFFDHLDLGLMPKAFLRLLISKMTVSKKGIELDGERWDSQSKFARAIGVCVRSVYNIEEYLINKGWISKETIHRGLKKIRIIRLTKLAITRIKRYANLKKVNNKPSSTTCRTAPAPHADELISNQVNTHSNTVEKKAKGFQGKASSKATELGTTFLHKTGKKFVNYQKLNNKIDQVLGKLGDERTMFILTRCGTIEKFNTQFKSIMSSKTTEKSIDRMMVSQY